MFEQWSFLHTHKSLRITRAQSTNLIPLVQGRSTALA